MNKIIEIQGMSCIKCVALIKEVLSEVKGIESIKSVELGKAVVVPNNNFDENEIKKILSEEEFEVISIINE